MSSRWLKANKYSYHPFNRKQGNGRRQPRGIFFCSSGVARIWCRGGGTKLHETFCRT